MVSTQSVIGHHKKSHLQKPIKYIACQHEKRAQTPPPPPTVITDLTKVRIQTIPRPEKCKKKKEKYQDPVIDSDMEDDSSDDNLPDLGPSTSTATNKKEGWFRC